MKKYVNGMLMDMSEAEERELAELLADVPETAQPTPEERIAALEEQLAAAKILLGVE